jgi:hypothetical protein
MKRIEPFTPDEIPDLPAREDLNSIKAFPLPVFYWEDTGEFLNPSYAAFYISQELGWDCALNWLYKKKWNKKHKHPYQHIRDLYKATEPLGALLRSTFDLCVELHQHSNGSTNDYVRGSQWFAYVASELRYISFFYATQPDSVKLLRKISQAFRYPDTKTPIEGGFPHLSRLMKASADVRRAYPDFASVFLLATGKSKRQKHPGFVSALSAWASVLQMSKVFSTHIATPQVLRWKHTDGKSFKKVPKDLMSQRLWGISDEPKRFTF